MTTTPLGRQVITLGTSSAAVLTCPPNAIWTINAAVAFNTSGSNVKITFNCVSGGSTVTTKEIAERTLSSRESWSCPELLGVTLQAGESIYAKADTADAVNLKLNVLTQVG